MLFLGNKISAEELFDMDSLSGITKSSQDLENMVKTYAQELLSSAPLAVSHVKNLVYYVAEHSHEASFV
jgi:enoyl-CoA hydratase/carnithine racemase